MKTFIILVLLLALAGALAWTRPSRADFDAYVHAQMQSRQQTPLGQLMAGLEAKQFLEACTYKNFVLWATIQKDGKTVYFGLLSHWFVRGASQPQPSTQGVSVA
jgi:hypothetical protein